LARGICELLQNGVFVEGVGALGQTLGAGQQIAEGALVHTPAQDIARENTRIGVGRFAANVSVYSMFP
jgi:hypothetical protein